MNVRTLITLLLATTIASLVPAWTQSTSGNLLGRVTDSSGAVVAGAAVSITRQETGFRRNASTDVLGNYEFPILEPGTYTITMEAKGFKKYTDTNVILLARQTLRIDVFLEIGSVTEQITVAGEAPAINTDTAQISETRTAKLLNEGPEATTIMNRFGLDTGAWSLTIRSIGYGEDDYKSMGSRATMWETAVDGNAVAATNVGPPFSAVAEEKDSVLNNSAELRTPVLIDAITKQGTNQIHGEFNIQFHQAAFNALAPGPPDQTRGPQTGQKYMNITGGGPVYIPKIYDGRNKTFFFLSAERVPPVDTSFLVATSYQAGSVPTPAMRNGDFAKYLADTNPGLQLIDPLNGQPFPGNIIPRSRWNPAAINAVDKYYPLPNFSGVNNPDIPVQNDNQNFHYTCFYSQWFARGDQKVTDRNTAGFSFSHRVNSGTMDEANIWGEVGTTPPSVFKDPADAWSWFDTHIFTPNLLNEFRMGWYHLSNYGESTQTAKGVIDTLGINLGPDATQRENYYVLPNINITGFESFGNFWGGQIYERTNWWQFRDNVTWRKGRHSLKFGLDQRFKRFDSDDVDQAVVGDQNYTGRFTGDPFADFVLGLPQSTVEYTPRPTLLGRYSEFGAFVQDDFQVTSNLKLNLGFRVDRISPRTDANDAYFNFDPATGAVVVPNQKAISLVNPAFPKNIPIELAGSVGYPASLTNALFSPTPRFGLAWRPFGKTATVLRAAYGVFAADAGSAHNNFVLLQGGGPFALSQTFVNQITNGVPLVTLNNPFPASATGAPPAFNISGVNPNLHTPYMQQWNVTVEHQFGTFWAVRLSYVGAKTTNIIYSSNIDEPPPSLIPFTPARNQYPNFQSVNWFNSGGNSNYNALHVGFTHRWTNGVFVDGLFQYQSEISDVQDTAGYPSIEDPYDRDRERAKAAINPLDFRVNFIYHFPFGPAQRFGSNVTRGHLVSGLIGGWEFAGIFDSRSGRPGTVIFAGADPSNTNTFGGRASVVPGCNIHPFNGENGPYLNLSCFNVPAPGTFGTASNDVFSEPGLWDLSGTVYKFFPLGGFLREKVTLRFSMTAANMFNHPQWGSIGNNISIPATFGELQSPGAPGRSYFAGGGGGRAVYLNGQVRF